MPQVVQTITIRASDAGTTIATAPQRLLALRYLNPPSSGMGAAIFELIDDSVIGVPRTIYRLDLNNAMWVYPQKNSAIWQELVSNQTTPFGNLTASKVPNGVVIDVDVG
jgi:hypothetical protein